MSELAADLGSLSQREFRVGGALSKAIGVFGRNAVPFSLVSILAWLPVGLIVYSTLDMPEREKGMRVILAGGLEGLLDIIALAAIVHAILQDMGGRHIRLGESALRGLRRPFPLVGALVLFDLAFLLGLALLVIPGVILLVRWSVFAPVCVVEGKGALESFKRSAELTEGSRWKLFALLLTLILAGMAVTALVKLGLAAALAPAPALFLSGIWQGAWSAFTNVLSVVVYHDLRAAKEGAGIESIASVFD